MSCKKCLVLGIAVGMSGCGLMQPIQATSDYFLSALSPKGHDQKAWADEESDAWVEEAGREARADQKRQEDPDQWYKNYFMSEKARSIERNLGVD